MYSNTSAEIRPELAAVVEEAAAADKSFIADKLFPAFPADSKIGEYRKITKQDSRSLDAELGDVTIRAARSPYKEVDRTYSKDVFNCVDRGLQEVLDDADQADIARFFDLESTTAKLLTRNIQISYEKRVATKLMDVSTWGAIDAAVEYADANLATIDFALDVQKAVELLRKRGEEPNAIVLSRPLWHLARRSALLQKFVFGSLSLGQNLSAEIVSDTLSEGNPLTLYIAQASYVTAPKGKTITDSELTWVWPSTHFWVGNVQAGGPEVGGAGRTFVWNEDASGLFVVETFRDEARRSDVVRVRQHTDEKVINPYAGVLVDTAP